MTDCTIEIGAERFETSTAELAQATAALSGARASITAAIEPENQSARYLRLFIERIERLEEEKKGILDDIRDVYAEAKSQGYEPKIMRQVVRLRKMDAGERQEMEAILETYKAALGLG